MTSRRGSRPPATTASLGLVGLLVVTAVGCSGSSPSAGGGERAAAEAGTSTGELCGALVDFRADLADADPGDPAGYVVRLQAAETRLRAVGLPDEMPAEARAGFTAQLDLIASLPAAATEADLASVGQAAEDPALATYLSATCPGT